MLYIIVTDVDKRHMIVFDSDVILKDSEFSERWEHSVKNSDTVESAALHFQTHNRGFSRRMDFTVAKAAGKTAMVILHGRRKKQE